MIEKQDVCEKRKKQLKEASRRFKERNPDYHREYYHKVRIKKNPNLNIESHQKRKHKDSYKKAHKKSKKVDYQKHKENYRVREKARREIPIPKNQLCQKCKINKAKERHHDDYKKPLEVIFVCHKCHVDLHRKGTSKSK